MPGQEADRNPELGTLAEAASAHGGEQDLCLDTDVRAVTRITR